MKAIVYPFAALVAVASVSNAAHADSQLGDRAINELVAGDGEHYLDAAKQILANDKLSSSIVNAADSATFTEENFERLAVEAALAARAKNQAAVESLGDLTSLEPATYLRQRRQIPAAGRELASKKLPVGALLEAYLWPDAHFQMRTADAYPPEYRERVPELRVMESRAFNEAVLMALVDTHHPAAAFALLRELYNPKGTYREIAAVLLGRCDASIARGPLSLIVSDKSVGYDVREAAVVGLGKLREAKAAVTLSKVAEDVGAPLALRKAAIIALGQSGSAWALKSKAQGEANTVRAVARGTLIKLLPTVVGTELADAVKTSIILLEDPAVLDALSKLEADSTLGDAALQDVRNAKRGLQRSLRRQQR